jgi:hypothetical protein
MKRRTFAQIIGAAPVAYMISDLPASAPELAQVDSVFDLFSVIKSDIKLDELYEHQLDPDIKVGIPMVNYAFSVDWLEQYDLPSRSDEIVNAGIDQKLQFRMFQTMVACGMDHEMKYSSVAEVPDEYVIFGSPELQESTDHKIIVNDNFGISESFQQCFQSHLGLKMNGELAIAVRPDKNKFLRITPDAGKLTVAENMRLKVANGKIVSEPWDYPDGRRCKYYLQVEGCAILDYKNIILIDCVL